MCVRGPEPSARYCRDSLVRIETHGIEDERVAFPFRDRIAVGRRIEDVLADVCRAIQVDVPRRGIDLSGNGDRLLALADVKGPWRRHDRRHPEDVAPADRFEIFLRL